MWDLNEKVVLITGGASGIGFSCVKELLRAGVQGVAIADIDDANGKAAEEETIKEFGRGKVLFIRTDVTKSEQFEEAFKQTLNRWKSIDVLINNAATFNDKQWELEININAGSVVRGTLLGMKYMGKDKGGKGGVIVNVSSTLGLQEKSSLPIYSGTKRFIVGFSRSLGTPYYFDRTGIKVTIVCPGLTTTPLSSRTFNSDDIFLFPDLRQLYVAQSDGAITQPPEVVAQGIVKSIKEGSNGSIWVAEKGEVYEVVMPVRQSLRKME